MKRGARGSTQSFWGKWAGGAGLTGGCGDGAGRAEGGCCAQDCADIAGILHTSKNDEQGRARRSGSLKNLVERGRARMHESGDPLGMLGVGEPVKQTVGGAQNGKANLWAVNQRSKPRAVALPGFAKQNRLDGAAGAQSFFDKPHSFDSDRAGFRRQTATQCDAELLEPSIIAAGEESGRSVSRSVASGFASGSHYGEGNKFAPREGKVLAAGGQNSRNPSYLRRCQNTGGCIPIARPTRCVVASPD